MSKFRVWPVVATGILTLSAGSNVMFNFRIVSAVATGFLTLSTSSYAIADDDDDDRRDRRDDDDDRRGCRRDNDNHDDDDDDAHAQLSIFSVIVDLDDDLIMITGENFDNCAAPEVSLPEFGPSSLAVTLSTSTFIVAELPALITVGDYRLVVTTGRKDRQSDQYDLTIGAIGSEGTTGPAGADGADGAVGPQGMKGDQGIPGMQGDPGDQGSQGIQGDRGMKGDPGLPGTSGLFGQSCAPGTFLTGFDSAGILVCAGIPTGPMALPPLLAVAYINDDGVDGYTASHDTLIAGLFDTNGDGMVSVGDEVRTKQYPLDFGATAPRGAFIATTHVVTAPPTRTATIVTIEAGDSAFTFTSRPNAVDLGGIDQYTEQGVALTDIIDCFGAPECTSDTISVNTASPSKPDTPVVGTFRGTSRDDAYIDVDIFP